MPVTSPACHSINLCIPPARSAKMARRPLSITKRPVTGTPLALSTSPGLRRPVLGQPGELLARRRAKRLVPGEPIDEICSGHEGSVMNRWGIWIMLHRGPARIAIVVAPDAAVSFPSSWVWLI